MLARKKCPSCGSMNTVEILYGMPAPDACNASEKGELIIGGCSYSPMISPTRHCKKCKIDYGVDDPHLKWIGLKSFGFYIGGFSSETHYIYIDPRDERHIVLCYTNRPDCRHIEKYQLTHKNHSDVEKKILPVDEWNKIKDKLMKLELDCWKDEYIDPYILDGTEWEVTIKFSAGEELKKYGSNLYPPYWKNLIKIMKKYVNDQIEE